MLLRPARLPTGRRPTLRPALSGIKGLIPARRQVTIVFGRTLRLFSPTSARATTSAPTFAESVRSSVPRIEFRADSSTSVGCPHETHDRHRALTTN